MNLEQQTGKLLASISSAYCCTVRRRRLSSVGRQIELEWKNRRMEGEKGRQNRAHKQTHTRRGETKKGSATKGPMEGERVRASVATTMERGVGSVKALFQLQTTSDYSRTRSSSDPSRYSTTLPLYDDVFDSFTIHHFLLLLLVVSVFR